ncbi:MAG: hypothetical protein M1837_005959 [Sclerophora amabilis]|nr:MAG: hypothetical protein M1837_005959 [Sclerophora amabilis]
MPLAFTALARERGLSASSAKVRHKVAPTSAPLRPSTSIPDYRAIRTPKDEPRLRPLPMPNGSESDQGLRSSSHSSFRRSPLSKHSDDESQEVRASLRSALTTNSSVFNPSTGTEGSSLVTDRSSLSDLACGRPEGAGEPGFSVDDAIGMYEGGFSDAASALEVNGADSIHDNGESHSEKLAEAMNSTIGDWSHHRPNTAPSQGHLDMRRHQRGFHGPAPSISPFSTKPPEPRDRYGFRKASQHVTLAQYDTWNLSYTESLARRRKKWVSLLKDSGLNSDKPIQFPPKSAKLKRFVRKGVPPEWRGAAWFWYAGGHARLQRYPDLYKQLLEQAEKGGVSEIDEELIERDLNRTFPDNIKFKPDLAASETVTANAHGGGRGRGRSGDGFRLPPVETPILESLRRVLQAFSIHTPRIGYCQSLNFIAGLLLLFMKEEEAFWMLNIITQSYLPGTHEVNLEGANVDLAVLMMSIKESMPAVWAKIGGELDGSSGGDRAPTRLPPITLCTTAWFMSCYIGTLPIETVLRVWDSFFYEGSKTLFRIAMAIFKVGEQEIKAVNDPMEIFQVVQTIPRKLIDASALMEACFKRRNGFGHLSQETVDSRRKGWRTVYAKERANVTASTAAAAAGGPTKEGEGTNDARGGGGFAKESNSIRSKLRRVDSRARLGGMNLLKDR